MSSIASTSSSAVSTLQESHSRLQSNPVAHKIFASVLYCFYSSSEIRKPGSAAKNLNFVTCAVSQFFEQQLISSKEVRDCLLEGIQRESDEINMQAFTEILQEDLKEDCDLFVKSISSSKEAQFHLKHRVGCVQKIFQHSVVGRYSLMWLDAGVATALRTIPEEFYYSNALSERVCALPGSSFFVPSSSQQQVTSSSPARSVTAEASSTSTSTKPAKRVRKAPTNSSSTKSAERVEGARGGVVIHRSTNREERVPDVVRPPEKFFGLVLIALKNTMKDLVIVDPNHLETIFGEQQSDLARISHDFDQRALIDDLVQSDEDVTTQLTKDRYDHCRQYIISICNGRSEFDEENCLEIFKSLWRNAKSAFAKKG
ncbi:MAG: hypothetical protein P4L16_04465 [Chlamydiales bacterium]|nr:hypothetical protein [Chlamydiales bacterium]